MDRWMASRNRSRHGNRAEQWLGSYRSNRVYIHILATTATGFVELGASLGTAQSSLIWRSKSNGQVVGQVPISQDGAVEVDYLAGPGWGFFVDSGGGLLRPTWFVGAIHLESCSFSKNWAQRLPPGGSGPSYGLYYLPDGRSTNFSIQHESGAAMLYETSESWGCDGALVWAADGTRRDIKFTNGDMCIKGITAADSMPNGGFVLATKDKIYLTNANGSSTCKGCGPSVNCDDKDPCTTDTCDPALGECTHTAIANCKKSKGTCIIEADCDDGDPCTGDACDALTGACAHKAQEFCGSGNTCVSSGKCIAGVCTLAPESMGVPKPFGSFPTQGWVYPLDGARPQVLKPNRWNCW